MLNLRVILSQIYADRSDQDLYDWLDQKLLLEHFKKVVIQLNQVISNEEALRESCGVVPVGHIAGNMLVEINRYIAKESNQVTTNELENILGDICSAILLSFLKSLKFDRQKVWLQITCALKDACIFYTFDFNQMIKFLKIDEVVSLLQSQKKSEIAVTAATIPALVWKGDESIFEEFLNIFVDQNLVRLKRSLFKLFHQPSEPLQLIFYVPFADLTLQFFYTLKNRRLVSFVGSDGFYQVLEYHILDFKKLFLKGKDAKRRINTLRNSKAKWNENQKRIDKWLECILTSKTGHPTVPLT